MKLAVVGWEMEPVELEPDGMWKRFEPGPVTLIAEDGSRHAWDGDDIPESIEVA